MELFCCTVVQFWSRGRWQAGGQWRLGEEGIPHMTACKIFAASTWHHPHQNTIPLYPDLQFLLWFIPPPQSGLNRKMMWMALSGHCIKLACRSSIDSTAACSALVRGPHVLRQTSTNPALPCAWCWSIIKGTGLIVQAAADHLVHSDWRHEEGLSHSHYRFTCKKDSVALRRYTPVKTNLLPWATLAAHHVECFIKNSLFCLFCCDQLVSCEAFDLTLSLCMINISGHFTIATDSPSSCNEEKFNRCFLFICTMPSLNFGDF